MGEAYRAREPLLDRDVAFNDCFRIFSEEERQELCSLHLRVVARRSFSRYLLRVHYAAPYPAA